MFFIKLIWLFSTIVENTCLVVHTSVYLHLSKFYLINCWYGFINNVKILEFSSNYIHCQVIYSNSFFVFFPKWTFWLKSQFEFNNDTGLLQEYSSHVTLSMLYFRLCNSLLLLELLASFYTTVFPVLGLEAGSWYHWAWHQNY